MKHKSGPDKTPAEQVVKDIRRQTRRQYSAEEKIRIVGGLKKYRHTRGCAASPFSAR
jgi:ribosomal protein L31E